MVLNSRHGMLISQLQILSYLSYAPFTVQQPSLPRLHPEQVATRTIPKKQLLPQQRHLVKLIHLTNGLNHQKRIVVQFERTTILLFYSFFILGSNISDAINPNISAAETPTAHEVNPPVKSPRNPCSSIAFFIPFHKTLPNPVRGTVAPAPANLT